MMSDGIIMTLVSVSWIMCPPPVFGSGIRAECLRWR